VAACEALFIDCTAHSARGLDVLPAYHSRRRAAQSSAPALNGVISPADEVKAQPSVSQGSRGSQDSQQPRKTLGPHLSGPVAGTPAAAAATPEPFFPNPEIEAVEREVKLRASTLTHGDGSDDEEEQNTDGDHAGDEPQTHQAAVHVGKPLSSSMALQIEAKVRSQYDTADGHS